MNFYTVLGIARDADEMAIRAAYRLLARRYHPDSGRGSSAEKFRQVAEAYETLSDPKRRHGYDLSLASPQSSPQVVVEPLNPSHASRSFRTLPFRPAGLFHDPFDDWIRYLENDLFSLFWH
jgi:DnaJ-class molecular chaperone